MTTKEYFDKMWEMKAEEVSRLMVENGSPTEGALAEALWHFLSSNKTKFSPETCSSIYDAAGYVPFSGYPLQRHRE